MSSSVLLCTHVAAAALALHAGDLPHGFARTDTRGSSTSYRVQFARVTTTRGLQEGPLEIDSLASVYPTPAAARSALRRAVPRGVAGLAVGYRLGEEAHQYVVQLGSALGALLRYTIIWRDGPIVGSVTVTGRVGVVSTADLAPPARAQEARIVRAATQARRSCPSHA